MHEDERLNPDERSLLLKEARNSIECVVNDTPLMPLKLNDYPPTLRKNGVVFVTLTIDGALRGCVGALEARKPLIEDVREHAIAAAQKDFRFQPVSPSELEFISIEISRLSAPKPLNYDSPADLINKIRPGIDGVVMKDGLRRATFLPQVWQKLPSIEIFLDHLCQKMGVPGDYWRHQKMEILVYQVEEFHE